jgi:predicted amidophosphoribosyltransferase
MKRTIKCDENKLRHIISECVRRIIFETLACLGGNYAKRIRYLCHAIKNGDIAAIDEASLIMAKYVPAGSILIPIPSHNGRATYTLKLAQFIAKRSKSKVMDILSSPSRESMYNLKQKNVNVKNVNLNFTGISDADGSIAKILSSAHNVILIDNVVSSGVTYEQAQNEIKRRYGVDAWMLSLGAVQNSPYDREEKRVIRSIF